ncbi:SPOR domain-containing protein [Ralstonia sp. UBA689]|uniref:SPOR domain-containing protein n=1 Tax=Ralstonia sp. UBA689 TaxID=1947373 RepID=UPI0025DC9BD8|nr:SPOR domain-containing protein [Ralstonia sp. UBA689]
MTLRLALLLLLLVNGVLLAANTGVFGPDVPSAWFESEREPERMRRQIRTEAIRILEPAPASGAAAPNGMPASAPAAAGASADTKATIERTALSTASTPDSAGSCIELGGLTDAQATRGLDQLKQLAGVQVERISRPEDNRWWVHMPARDTREDAERKVAELKRRNVGDSAIVQEGNSFVVSLGLFRDKERAQQRLDDVRAKDVRTAVLTETHRNGSRTWLRITTAGAPADAASSVAAQLATLKKNLGGDEMRACATPAAAVTASR